MYKINVFVLKPSKFVNKKKAVLKKKTKKKTCKKEFCVNTNKIF